MVQFEELRLKLLESEKQQTLRYKAEADELREKLSKQKVKSEERYAEIINKANLEAKEILEEAKESADGIIKELQDLRKAKSQSEFDRKATKARDRYAKDTGF